MMLHLYIYIFLDVDKYNVYNIFGKISSLNFNFLLYLPIFSFVTLYVSININIYYNSVSLVYSIFPDFPCRVYFMKLGREIFEIQNRRRYICLYTNINEILYM